MITLILLYPSPCTRRLCTPGPKVSHPTYRVGNLHGGRYGSHEVGHGCRKACKHRSDQARPGQSNPQREQAQGKQTRGYHESRRKYMDAKKDGMHALFCLQGCTYMCIASIHMDAALTDAAAEG